MRRRGPGADCAAPGASGLRTGRVSEVHLQLKTQLNKRQITSFTLLCLHCIIVIQCNISCICQYNISKPIY